MKTNSILSNLTAPALFILLFAACESDNHATDDGPVAARITSTIDGTAQTRASETAWTDGDPIGVSATSTEGATA